MPSTVRARASTLTGTPNKRTKLDSTPQTGLTLPTGDALSAHQQRYAGASPYRYAAIGGLISDELLEGVVEESRTYGVRGEESSLRGWGWEQKETDIYKVGIWLLPTFEEKQPPDRAVSQIQQTPDLSSLDPEHLPDDTLAALPYLTKLKDALYSSEFRTFIREVTGCGPLSGKKTDGSVGLYTQGSHLLLHDDSISTRLVSYILYLPNSPPSAPSSSRTPLTPSASGSFTKGWDPAWGGSLELYPVDSVDEVGLPGVKRAKKVDVKWGQLVFFEVQPGRSYHAVEEVIVGDGRQRLGVSGWFHRPVQGEQGYEPLDKEKQEKDLSSLAQITSAPSAPFTSYTADPPAGLTSSHISFLAPFLAPSYLTPATLEKLSGQFVAASEIVLHNFLHPDIAAKLKAETQAADKRDYPDSSLPSQGVGEGDGWTIQGPTSKCRYTSLTTSSLSSPTAYSVLTHLFPSEAFRAWLSVVSSLAPTAYRTEARRFRRGLDYTLASGEEKSGEVRLDVSLGATWWADMRDESEEEDALLEHGGWNCYLAAPEEGEDPAIYQSTTSRPSGANDEQNEGVNDVKDPANHIEEADGLSLIARDRVKTDGSGAHEGNGVALEIEPGQLSPSDFDSDSDSDEDDGPLLTQPVSFNKLLLVLRDPGVMRFVKYLSAGAEGSRWDIGGEWEVGVMEEQDSEGSRAGQ